MNQRLLHEILAFTTRRLIGLPLLHILDLLPQHYHIGDYLDHQVK